ncbi:MAG: 3-phosphoshikimate 1-carboxyvinyltransferase [Actinobacteria bacterium]|nr:3-phosphoshikimate 1-carboxyvinyltransferase [Actinomycetota bacterium]
MNCVQEGQGYFGPAPNGLVGTVRVPGDKSISHRSVLLGAVNSGPVTVDGFLRSADTLATIRAIRALGVDIEELDSCDGSKLIVYGRGWDGLEEPVDVIDVANAGTLIRLLPGILASCPFFAVLNGDASIRRRPMARILQPLAQMGATVSGRQGGRLPPFTIQGGRLRAGRHQIEVASAQVKSCLILAALRADGQTLIDEPGPSRDHTETMVCYGGAQVRREGDPLGPGTTIVTPLSRDLDMGPVTVPGDISSAAFLLVAALIVPGSRVTVEGVGLNPTRTGLLDVLQEMGADLTVMAVSGEVEPMGAVTAAYTPLHGCDIAAEKVPLLIDELPIWALAAACAEGTSRVRGAAELRLKESDRLAATAQLLRTLGIEVHEHQDGLDIIGNPQRWKGTSVASHGDHRLAMVGAVAGLASRTGVTVDDIECIGISYPDFAATIEQLIHR